MEILDKIDVLLEKALLERIEKVMRTDIKSGKSDVIPFKTALLDLKKIFKDIGDIAFNMDMGVSMSTKNYIYQNV